jgi:predicted transcriptional regulator
LDEHQKAVEAWSGKMLTNAEITRLLNNLIDLGIVVKTNGVYEITDPLVREYCCTHMKCVFIMA